MSSKNHSLKGNSDFNSMSATLEYAFFMSRTQCYINIPFTLKTWKIEKLIC